jgi:hypothetical protein
MDMIAGDHVIQHRKTEALFGFEYPFITFAEIVGQENFIPGTDCGLGVPRPPANAWDMRAPCAKARGDRE